jgi:hypothetical protein
VTLAFTIFTFRLRLAAGCKAVLGANFLQTA